MPVNGDDDPGWAVDTSVAVAYLDADHSAHAECVSALVGKAVALAGHAAFETYSVLTRLPGGAIGAGDARKALSAAFAEPRWLTPAESTALFGKLATIGIRAGAVYDALVGEAARVHELTLLTRDRRAIRTYDLIGTRYEVVGP